MKNVKQLLIFVTVAFTSQVTAQYYVPQNQQRMRLDHYSNFMRQYQGRENQIITPDNMINMDWARGAVNALRQDGYTQNKDIALVLWQNIANIVNYTASLPANRNNAEEFKTRMWQSLERTMNEISSQQQHYARPVQNAQTRPLPSLSQELTRSISLEDIMNGVLGADYARKAREVTNYNYNKVTHAGFANLANEMSGEISGINANRSLDRSGKIMVMRKVVDRFFSALETYRARDRQ